MINLPNNTPVIDCRPADQYRDGHIKDATHIPADMLFSRMHELPKRSVPLSVCVTDACRDQAVDFLEDKGYQLLQVILWNDKITQQLSTADRLECGIKSRQLWQPAPLLKTFVENQNKWEITPGNGLDLACGSGRDMVYLAQQGWKMTGVDYLPGALQRSQSLAANHGINIETRQLDLETEDNPFTADMQNRFDLVCIFRYLHRPILPYIKELVKPGGTVIYQTFMRGCETISSPRNPRFLLEPGELANEFTGFEILMDEIEQLEDGRPVSAFIAQRC